MKLINYKDYTEMQVSKTSNYLEIFPNFKKFNKYILTPRQNLEKYV